MSHRLQKALYEEATTAIDAGDVSRLRTLTGQHSELARPDYSEQAPNADNTLLLYLTNWPAGKPNGAASAETLVAAGANVNIRNNGDGETVLHWAASNDKGADIIDVLLDAGAEIDALGGVIRGGPAVLNALFFGFTEIGAQLVGHGAFTDNLVIAAGLGRVERLGRWYRDGDYLKDATRLSPTSPFAGKALLDTPSAQHWTYDAVICALCCHQFHVADWFIERGFDIEHTPEGIGWSCLHHAAYKGDLAMAMYLVAKGASLDIRTREHDVTPADYGYAHGHPEVMNYLIDQGTPITLGAAAATGRLDKVMQGHAECPDKALLLADTIGNTTAIGKPIHEDIKRGRLAVAQYLLQKDPQLHQTIVDGKTALTQARQAQDQELIALLIEHEAKQS